MTTRLPQVQQVLPDVYKDVSEKVMVRLHLNQNDLETPFPIPGNTANPYKKRHIDIKINATSNSGKEMTIFGGSIKLLYCAAPTNSPTESWLDYPVISPGGNIIITKDDIIDTLTDVINRANNVYPF
jgi:hypothetical protein